MAIRLFFKRETNFFKSVVSGILKRGFCSPLPAEANGYKYLLILDFEATCDRVKGFVQEIIEFPCIKVDANTIKEVSRFHHYVRPTYSPILTNFCVELTGILQEVVDESDTFSEVYPRFEEWREKEGLTKENSLYVTSGDWDLGHMIKLQCQLCQLDIPPHMTIWADIKKVFANSHGYLHNSLVDLMRYYNLNFEGRQHSGIDDCLNMVRLMQKMKEDGVEFMPTSKLDTSTMKVVSANRPVLFKMC